MRARIPLLLSTLLLLACNKSVSPPAEAGEGSGASVPAVTIDEDSGPATPGDPTAILTVHDQSDVPQAWRECATPDDCVALGGCCPCQTSGTIALNQHYQNRVRVEQDCSETRCRVPTGEHCAIAVASCPVGGGLCTYVTR